MDSIELNFNIADLFNILHEFECIVKDLHKTAGDDEFEQKRLKAAMTLAKACIEDMLDQVGEIGKGE